MSIKKSLVIIISLIAIILSVYFFGNENSFWKAGNNGKETAFSNSREINAVFKVEGGVFTVKNGEVLENINSMSKEAAEVKIFGEPAKGDLNGDGLEDGAVLINYKTAKGEASYAAAMINDKNKGIVGTNALLLGEKVSPQDIFIEKGKILANYEIKTKEGKTITIMGRFKVDGFELKPSN